MPVKRDPDHVRLTPAHAWAGSCLGGLSAEMRDDVLCVAAQKILVHRLAEHLRAIFAEVLPQVAEKMRRRGDQEMGEASCLVLAVQKIAQAARELFPFVPMRIFVATEAVRATTAAALLARAIRFKFRPQFATGGIGALVHKSKRQGRALGTIEFCCAAVGNEYVVRVLHGCSVSAVPAEALGNVAHSYSAKSPVRRLIPVNEPRAAESYHASTDVPSRASLFRITDCIHTNKEIVMTKTLFTAALVILGTTLLGACRTYPDYANDFRFPILQGDVARGQEAFVAMGCHMCHTVDGIELADNARLRPVTVNLGGDLIFAKTYGDLVTSILNPSHVISEEYLQQLPRTERSATSSSPMYVNPDMKVTQLIDIVAFLNSRYRLLPGYTEYYYQ